jgi:DNA-binding transcriptional ArsR family regulator
MPHVDRTTSDERRVNQAVEQFDLLGNRTRLKIMLLLDQKGEMTVNELHHAVGKSLPTISRQLKLLRWGLLVESRRRRNYIYYRLASQTARDLLQMACSREKPGANQD